MRMLPGVISFLLFLLGDVNDAFWQRRWLKPSFSLGFILLAASTGWSIWANFPEAFGLLNILFLAAAVFFAFLMIWALFFSFPSAPAYVETSTEREAFTGGMYALCRHPGVVWFCFLYCCLIPGAGFPAVPALLYCVMNVLLALMEDVWIFPRVFTNYREYKQRTPFLIPTPGSFRMWIGSIGKNTKERG